MIKETYMYDKVTFQISCGQKAKLETLAYDENISVSEYIRRALNKYAGKEMFSKNGRKSGEQ